MTVRPIARLFPLPPAPLTVGRAGRAWPVPCRWAYRRLGGCGLRDRPHRRLRPGRGAITSALGWRGGDRLTLTASAGVMVARRDRDGMITVPGWPCIVIPAAVGAACGRLRA